MKVEGEVKIATYLVSIRCHKNRYLLVLAPLNLNNMWRRKSYKNLLVAKPTC